jgi:hypothetical protein
VFFEVARSLSPGDTLEEAKANWQESEKGKEHPREFRPVRLGNRGYIDHYLLVAVALGTIFIGGMTYISNGPNFMVKSIAEQAGVPLPSFFGFMLYSCTILLPAIALTCLIFVRL